MTEWICHLSIKQFWSKPAKATKIYKLGGWITTQRREETWTYLRRAHRRERWPFIFPRHRRPTPKWVCRLTLAYICLLKFMYSEMRAMFKMHHTILDVSCLWFIGLYNTTRISRPPRSNDDCYRALSLTWSAAKQMYWNKRKCLHKKSVQLLPDWFGTPTWPPFHCVGTPIWLPWRHVKTLYK